MTEKPLVSFLMTVYNGMPLLPQTIDSLREQTWPNVEVVIVDDGSSDGSVDYLRQIAEEDPRVRVFTPGRLGRGPALNFALNQCRGTLIAINDADDPSMPQRAELEATFLLDNPEYGMVGSYFEIQDSQTGETRIIKHPTENDALREGLTRGQVFQHSTCMFTKAVMDEIGGYDENRRFLFDREIFIRTAAVSKVANLPHVLITLNRHGGQFFMHSFKGLDREFQDCLLKIRAIRTFGFPLSRCLPHIMKMLWVMIPVRIRHALPSSLRSRGRDMVV